MTNGNTHRKMQNKIILCTALLMCIAFLFLSACSPKNDDTITLLVPKPMVCNFYDESLLNANSFVSKPYEFDATLTSAVVPHHAPHLDLLCSLLSSDSVQNADYELVIVIGPNHTGNGSAIQVTGNGYVWNNGSISGDIESTNVIYEDFRLRSARDTTLFESDHSVSVLMPYIGYYLPDVSTIGILLSSNVNSLELEALCEDLQYISERQRTLILFSVDFSHYETPSNGTKFDDETKLAIREQQFNKILSWGNEHFDSPQAISLFLKYSNLSESKVYEIDYRQTIFKENGKKQSMSYFVFAGIK